MTSVKEQVDLLMQGTAYGNDHLRDAMAQELEARLLEAQRQGRPLRVYAGFDPRTSDLHIGHTVPIRKMRQFQELGHEVTFVIGRFTSMVGDPSDKDKVRAQLQLEEAMVNAQSYAEQALHILDPEKTRFAYNDTWLSTLNFADLIELGSLFTIQQFLTRDAFRKRFDENDAIYLHEFFYAIMQAYDAYHLRADVQIGGSDQLFNIITAGRKLMEAKGVQPNIGIIMGILPGTDGVIKMSKSLDNHIALTLAPEDMYGKVMSVPDAAMGDYFRLVTRWTPEQIAALERGLEGGEIHPRDAKMSLAREIVSIYHAQAAAEAAEAHFKRVFQDQAEPEEIDDFRLPGAMTLVEVLKASGMAASNSEARRLIDQRGVKLDEQLLEDPTWVVAIGGPAVLRVGRRRFIRLLPE